MANAEKVVERILEIGSTIRDLKLEAAPLKVRIAEIEVTETDLKSLALSLYRTGGAASETATPGASKSSPTRTKRRFAGSGMIRTLLDYMKANPDQIVTPESIASAVGMPNKVGLVRTCLKRLCDAKMIERTQTGHYVFRGPASYYLQPKPPKEPAMT